MVTVAPVIMAAPTSAMPRAHPTIDLGLLSTELSSAGNANVPCRTTSDAINTATQEPGGPGGQEPDQDEEEPLWELECEGQEDKMSIIGNADGTITVKFCVTKGECNGYAPGVPRIFLKGTACGEFDIDLQLGSGDPGSSGN